MAISFDINTLVWLQKKKQVPQETTIWVLHPKSSIENDIKWAMSSISRWENPDNLIKAYPSLNGKWKDVLWYMNDFSAWSWKNELIKAYPSMPKQISDELFAEEEIDVGIWLPEIWLWVVGLWWLYWIWRVLEKSWEKIYWTAFKESPQAAADIVRWLDVEWVRKTWLETKWIWGSVGRIWRQAYKQQQKLWSKISPYIKETIDVITPDELWKQMSSNISKLDVSKIKKNQILSELEPFIDDLRQTYKKWINMKEAQKLTSDWWADLSSVFKKTSKDLAAVPKTNEYNWMLIEARKVLREWLYKTISDRFWKKVWDDVIKSFQKYWNLWNIITDSEKQIQSKLLWWPLWISAGVIKETWTPIVTIAWKVLNKAGKLLQKPVNVIIRWWKILVKWAWKWLQTLNTVDPTWTMIPFLITQVRWRKLKWWQIIKYNQYVVWGMKQDDAIEKALLTDPEDKSYPLSF